jgi:hypothetical protein
MPCQHRDDGRGQCIDCGAFLNTSEDYQLAAPMLTREALELARGALIRLACEQDTASPEGHKTRLAIAHIQAMLDQQGLEVFRNGDDGTLPDFCDIVIYG